MSNPPVHCHRHDCMATFFEVRVVHENATYARQAAQAAFAVADRLERLLSRYRDDSEISRIRACVPGEVLRVSVDTFHCLELASRMQALTGGAFDPGLGAQMDMRRGQGPAGDVPRGQLLMDPEGFCVSVRDGVVALDLGAIGKGFALDRMAEELLAWDIDRALLVAGGSSLLALDGPSPGSAGWEIFLSPTQTLPLRRQAIGASGTAVKGAHILDPRTGLPTPGPYRAWAVHPSAATADALSTAWMLLERDEIERVCRLLPGTRAFLQPGEGQPEEIVTVGPC